MQSKRMQAGFTLVEIAIVLVIIGLLLGGILKGQEMITQARIKNVVNDFNGITAAYFAYQDRYRSRPRGRQPGRHPVGALPPFRRTARRTAPATASFPACTATPAPATSRRSPSTTDGRVAQLLDAPAPRRVRRRRDVGPGLLESAGECGRRQRRRPEWSARGRRRHARAQRARAVFGQRAGQDRERRRHAGRRSTVSDRPDVRLPPDWRRDQSGRSPASSRR